MLNPFFPRCYIWKPLLNTNTFEYGLYTLLVLLILSDILNIIGKHDTASYTIYATLLSVGKTTPTWRAQLRTDTFFFFNLTYSRWTSSLPSCLWSQRIFPSLPGSRLTIFLSRCKFSTLTTRQPMVEFYLLAFPRFPLRKKEHKSYFGKNRTHDFRTSRYAGYPLDHSGDERLPAIYYANYHAVQCRSPW